MDNEALAGALNDGRLAGAGIDVFDTGKPRSGKAGPGGLIAFSQLPHQFNSHAHGKLRHRLIR